MLAVIVLNWNGGDDLIACLESVYASEDCGMPIVVYVPDNASTDGSYEAVGQRFPQARLIQNGGNLGFSGGNNPGWRRAAAEGAEWVFFLNNDAAVAPDCLRRMLEVCRAHPEIGAACPKIFFGTPATHPDGKLSPDAEPAIWFEKGLCDFSRVGGVTHVEATAEERAATWYESPLCTGCCFLTTVELLEATGGFDEDFFAYYEDVDLSLKIRALGRKCAVVPSALSWHKVGQSTKKDASPGYVFYCSRNLYYLAERHAERPHAWAAFRRIYLREMMLLAVFFGNQASLMTGAAVLQGCQYARRRHTGVRPKKLPGPVLQATVGLLQRYHKLRTRMRGIRAGALVGRPPGS